MEDTQEFEEKAHEQVISDKESEKKHETPDEMLSRHSIKTSSNIMDTITRVAGMWFQKERDITAAEEGNRTEKGSS